MKGDQYLTENSRGIRGGGALSYDYFGSALAAGDLNRDGRDDLAIGAPSKEVFYDDSSDGAVHVLYGGRRHLRARDDQYLTADNLGFSSRSAADAGFGASLAAGDLNGDGRADLVVGSPAERVGEDERAGAVRTLLGGPRHLRRGSVRRLTENTKRMAGPGAGYGARFGSSLVIGRLNHGGRHDLAIGAPQAVHASSSEHLGAVHVLYGRRRGPSVRGDQYLSTRAPGIRGRGREFGHALATGDLNGDGHDELTIGAPRQGTGGAVHVLYGARRKLRLRNTQLLTQDRPGMAGDDPYPDDGFGFVLGSGDFDGDGRADLAIGEPQDRYGGFGGCATSLGGAVHVLYGARKRLSLKGDQFLTQDTPGVAGSGSEPCDAFGRGLANPFR